MKAELIIPLACLRGKLRNDGYYFRLYRGQQIVQRCPNRSNHIKTPAEAANRVAFGIVFGKERHREFIARTMKGQFEIEFLD